MGEKRFDEAVELARDTMKEFSVFMGNTTPEMIARNYILIAFSSLEHKGKLASIIRERGLELLIECSEEITAAWDGLNQIAKDLNRLEIPLPPELAKWKVEKPPRPTKRGPDPDRDNVRNQIIVYAIERLVENGMKATRNRLRNRAAMPECCPEGGSACDAVGVASGMTYKSVEKVWTNATSQENPPYRSSKNF